MSENQWIDKRKCKENEKKEKKTRTHVDVVVRDRGVNEKFGKHEVEDERC